MKLINKITDYEYLKNCFLGTNKNNSASYIAEEYDYSSQHNTVVKFMDFDDCTCPQKIYIFNCSCCRKRIDIKDVQIRNNIITCPCCNESVHLSQLASKTLKDASVEIMMHNINNGTELSINVPTIIVSVENKFYCNHCYKTRSLESDEFSRRDNKLICSCGAEYTFEECKISKGHNIFAAGNIYFDDNKISISIISKKFDVNKHENYYCQDGNTRATLNLETGYSYVTNKGLYYSGFNKEYQYRNGNNKKAPVIFNATYNCPAFNHLDLLSSAKVRELYRKYKDFPDLVAFITKHSYKLKNMIKHTYKKQIDKYMTDYFNNKYSYKIVSLGEGKDFNYNNVRFEDFVLKNRFVNLDYKSVKFVREFLYELKFSSGSDSKIKYSLMPRESSSPIIDYITKSLLVSKKLRKAMIKDMNDFITNDNANYVYIYTLFNFASLAKSFKKKESVNKIYFSMMNCDGFRANYCRFSENALKVWKSYRDEDYISNLRYGEMIDKLNLIQDSLRLLKGIQKVYGDDFSIDFKNEKQYHDDLTTVYNSEAFIEAKVLLKQQRLDELFVIEDKCLELTNDNIEIARTERQLCDIGNKMSICVGGYGNDVRQYNTRIAYIKEENEYKACLELKSIKDKKGSYKYELRQAKLAYNRLVGTNEKYYNIVFDWCKENDIVIVTGDMNKRYEQEA